MKVKNNQTGEIVEIDDIELPSAVDTGVVSIPQKDYEFEDSEGNRKLVPANSFQEAQGAGWKYIPESQIKDEALEEKYGDSTAKALIYGGLRAATLGASDYILNKTGIENPESLSEIKKRNDVSSMIGETAGFILPAVLTGGGNVVSKTFIQNSPKLAKILGYTPSALTMRGAEKAGLAVLGQAGRAAETAALTATQKAAQFGTAGAIEGAAIGLGKTISEDQLGDADFNAESLFSNIGTGALTGGIIGGVIGAGAQYLSKYGRGAYKEIRDRHIDDLDMPGAEKSALKESLDSGERIEDAINILNSPEVQEAANRVGIKPTTGMLSKNQFTKELESSLEHSAGLPSFIIQKETRAAKEGIQKGIEELTQKASEKTAYEAGDEVRKTIMGGINERLRPAQNGLSTVFKTFGEFDISDRMSKLLQNRFLKSDASKFSFDKQFVETVTENLAQIKTLNQANIVKKQIGKQLATEIRAGNSTRVELLHDAYDTLTRMEKKAISDAAHSLGPKTGPKAAKEAMRIYEESMAAYRNIYKDYKPVADSLGLKLKSPDTFLDVITEMPSESLQNKVLKMNDYAAAKELKKNFPELFDIGRGRRLAEFRSKVLDSRGNVSMEKFLTQIKGMSPEQKEILFGFGKEGKQKLADLITLAKSMPKRYGSDTAKNLTFLDMMNPAFHGKEMLRYALYRGGDAAIKNYLLKATPVMATLEKSANRSKDLIVSSVNSFFKNSKPAITNENLELFNEKKMEKVKKMYDSIESNPSKVIDDFVMRNKDLFSVAPKTAEALQKTLIAGVGFLQTKMPRPKVEYYGQDYQPSRSELIAFNDYVETVEKPVRVFDQLKKGYISPRSIEALKVVYPKIYSALVSQILTKMPKNISNAQRISLQQITGGQFMPVMDYQRMISLQGGSEGLQNNPNQLAQSGAGQTKPLKSNVLNSSGREQSSIDKVINRS